MPIAVRAARLEEAPLVHRIMLAAFATHLRRLAVASSAHAETIADVEAAMRRGGAALAWDGDVAVGSARWELRPNELYVGRVAVLPAHRRRGVASAMMRFVEALAPSLGRDGVRVDVRRSLPDNVALYRALGYEVVREDPHPRGPDVVLTMRKRIAR